MRRVGLAAALVALAASVGLAPASPRAGYDDCGRFEAVNSDGGSGVFEVRAKGMTCGGAKDVLEAFWKDGAGGYVAGGTDSVRRFRCKFVSPYNPPEVAFRCHHTTQHGKVAKALWTGD
jgi:hypothetical protein